MKNINTTISLFLAAITLGNTQTPGDVDGAFLQGYGASYYLWNLFPVSDDGFFVIGNGGESIYNDNQVSRLFKIQSDLSFDNTPDMYGLPYPDDVQVVFEQTDGKLIIGGSFNSWDGVPVNGLIRLMADGTPDPTFNIGSGPSAPVVKILQQPDGKLLISGYFLSYNGTAARRIARLNLDGSLDPTFNSTSGATSYINNMLLQPDGKIIISGNFNSYAGFTSKKIARINADGSFDATFNVGSGLSWEPSDMELLADGRVLVVGTFTTYNNINRAHIVMINSNGSIDLGFDPEEGFNYYPTTVHIVDDKILLVGEFSSYRDITRNKIARLNMDASLDLSFNPGDGGNSSIFDFVALPDSKLICVGSFSTFDDEPHKYIVKLNADGSVDPAVPMDYSGTDDDVFTIEVQPDNKILIGGQFEKISNIEAEGLLRLNPDGTLDDTFNYECTPTNGNEVYKTMLLPDGRIMVGGHNSFKRHFSDGSVDDVFNIYGSGPDGDVFDIALMPDGDYMIVGDFDNYHDKKRRHVCRVNTNGSRDNAFDPGVGADDDILTVAVQNDGKILVGGEFNNYDNLPVNYIARLNEDGTRDMTFITGAGFNDYVKDIVIQPDGKILIAGEFSAYDGNTFHRIIRLNTNGSIDMTFNPGTGIDGLSINTIELFPDGSMMLGGDFDQYNGSFSTAMVMISATGELDETFISHFEMGHGPVNDIAVQQDGMLLIGGSFNNYDHHLRSNIARIFGKPVCTIPTGVYHNSVTATKATIHWNLVGPVDYYHVWYRPTGAALWTKKTSTTSFKTLKSLTPSTEYEYKVRSKCLDGEFTEFSPIQNFTTLPLKEGEFVDDFAIYPNPSSGKFTIHSESCAEGIVYLNVFNSMGEMVYTKQVYTENNSFNETIEPGNLPAGIYTVQVVQKETGISKRIIIE